MDVKIYIHGRPQGGDIWTKDALDNIDASSYISPFLDYDIGRDVDALMIVDRWRNSSYYTYFCHKGLMENNPRRGANAYFAITIKIVGAYCQKVSMLYNLLKQVYEAKVLGNGKIIESYGNGGLQHFTTSSFKEKESVLTEIIGIIRANLERIVAPYISPLSQTTDTKNNATVLYSLDEVDSPKFEKMSENCRIIVSAQYQSFEQKALSLDKEKGEIAQQLTVASQKLSQYEQKLQKLKAEQEKSKKDVKSREERDAERKADAEYQTSRQEKADFQDYLQEKDEYKGYKSQKESFVVFQQYKDTLFDFSRRMAGTFSLCDKDITQRRKETGKDGDKKRISRFRLGWSIGVTIAIVFSVIINFIVVCKIYNKNDGVEPADSANIDSLQVSINDNGFILVKSLKGDTVFSSSIYNIGIEGYHTDKRDLYLQQRFPLTAINFTGNVQWTVSPDSNAVIEDGNILVPIAEGKITIHGKSNGAIIIDKAVTAVKK